MQVACSRCRTRYKIPNEKLEAGPIKVRCKECDHVFGVRRKKKEAAPPTEELQAAVAAPPEEEQDQPDPGDAQDADAQDAASQGSGSEDFGFGDLDFGEGADSSPAEEATSDEPEEPGEDQATMAEPLEEAQEEAREEAQEDEDTASEESGDLGEDFAFGDLDLGGLDEELAQEPEASTEAEGATEDLPAEELAAEEPGAVEPSAVEPLDDEISFGEDSGEEDTGEDLSGDLSMEEALEEGAQEAPVAEAADEDTFGFGDLDMGDFGADALGDDSFGEDAPDEAPPAEEAAPEVEAPADEPAAEEAAPASESSGEEGFGDDAFGDDAFGFGDLDLSEEDFNTDELSLGDEDVVDSMPAAPQQGAAQEEAPDGETSSSDMEMDLSDFDSSVFDEDADAKISLTSKGIEQSIEDIFDDAPAPAEEKPQAPAESSNEFSPGLSGELDLGAFDQEGPGAQADDPTVMDGLERVEMDDLVTQPPAAPDLAGGGDGPRLDLRKGERRSEEVAVPVYETVEKRRIPVILALLVSVVLGTAAFVGYNILVQPDAAFYFLNPGSFMEWLERGKADKVLKLTEPVEGAFLTREGKEPLYVISGWVTNTSPTSKSAIEVKATLYGPGGKEVGSSTSYCGNVIPQEELATLSDQEITERLGRRVGDDLTNLDVKRGDKVPFMTVFIAPPADVEKFTVDVIGSAESAKAPKPPPGRKVAKPAPAPEEGKK